MYNILAIYSTAWSVELIVHEIKCNASKQRRDEEMRKDDEI